MSALHTASLTAGIGPAMLCEPTNFTPSVPNIVIKPHKDAVYGEGEGRTFSLYD